MVKYAGETSEAFSTALPVIGTMTTMGKLMALPPAWRRQAIAPVLGISALGIAAGSALPYYMGRRSTPTKEEMKIQDKKMLTNILVPFVGAYRYGRRDAYKKAQEAKDA